MFTRGIFTFAPTASYALSVYAGRDDLARSRALVVSGVAKNGNLIAGSLCSWSKRQKRKVDANTRSRLGLQFTAVPPPQLHSTSWLSSGLPGGSTMTIYARSRAEWRWERASTETFRAALNEQYTSCSLRMYDSSILGARVMGSPKIKLAFGS